MPGRHASGPLGGGFGGGGIGGGGWQPRGPWNPRPSVPMFGGGGFGLLSFLPLLFFGRRGGCSFGCLPFLCIALVCLCLFSAGGIGGGSLYPGYSNVPQFPADNN